MNGLARFHETQNDFADFVSLAHSILLHHRLAHVLLALASSTDTNDSETVRTISKNLFEGTKVHVRHNASD